MNYNSVFFTSLEVASHALRFCPKSMVYSCSQFKLILLGLVLAPSCFAITLSLGNPLILLLKCFELSILFGSVLILKHASHTSYSGSLICVVLCFILFSLVVLVVLICLLFDPLFLLGGLECNTILVEQVLTLKLTAA